MSVNLKMDKRIKKTKQKIKSKYIELMLQKEPNTIQVKELCKQANINRSTFYERYGYIDKLIDEIIEEEVTKISLNNYDIESNYQNLKINKTMIKTYVESFCNNKILVRFCLVDNKDFYVSKIIHKQIEYSIKKLNNVSYYQALFQVVGVLSVLIEFLNNKKSHSIEDIVDIIYDHILILVKDKID